MIRPTCCWMGAALLLVLLGGGLSWPAPTARWMPSPGLALAGNRDGQGEDDQAGPDDDQDENDDRQDDRLAPVSAASLARGLRLGSIWVERSGPALVAVRVGIEAAGTMVATLTLNPTTLNPVVYMQRGLAQPRTVPTAAALSAALTRLNRLGRERITVGPFAVASAGGPLLPLYWGGQHVAYLTLDSRGQLKPDLAGSQALSTSTLKVKR